MRRMVLGIGIVLGIVLGIVPTAHAADDGCEAASSRFQIAHPTEYADAGSPPIVCEPVRNGALGGKFDGTVVHIYPAHGTADPDTYYRQVVAHEVGHAYAKGRFDHDTYAKIRGFTVEPYVASDRTMREDYAETFAFALGEWELIGSPPPFAFQTEAGAPTFAQLGTLACLGMMPGPACTVPAFY